MAPLPPIVFGIDDDYVKPLCAALRSLAKSSVGFADELRVIVLHEHLSADSAGALRAIATSLQLSLEPLKVTTPFVTDVSCRWSAATYLRLAIPEHLQSENVALYLDADVLVLSDIRPLLMRDISAVAVAAVQDPLSPTVRHGSVLPGWRELGLPENMRYFNAGVLLLNLEMWRALKIAQQCRDFLVRFPQHISHADQDALNVVLRHSWVHLSSVWNAFAASALEKIGWLAFDDDGDRRRQLLENEASAKILHFAGPKPWLYGFPESFALDTYRLFSGSD